MLRIHLIWIYRGAPSYFHFSLPEQATSIAWRIERGSVRIRCEKSPSVRAQAGTWLLPAHDKIQHDFSDDAVITSIRFKAHWPDNVPLYDDKRSVMFKIGRFPRFESATQQLQRLVTRSTHGRGRQVRLLQEPLGFVPYLRFNRGMLRWMEAYADVMSRLAVPPGVTAKHDPRVAQARQSIEDMPMERRLDERDLARSVGLSPSQLNRLFVASVGLTARAFAEKRRIDFAREKLLTSTMPVKEIAYRLGFHHSSHFSAWCRKKLDVYPSQYRVLHNVDMTKTLG